MVRLDVDGGETRVSVYRGQAELDDGAAGSTCRRASAPTRAGGRGRGSHFVRHPRGRRLLAMDLERESQDRWAARSSEYLPRELDPYAGEFESNGNWRYESEVGLRLVAARERRLEPLLERHWSWTPYGWTWIPLRVVGLGALPLRALGLLRLVRLVLDAGARLGSGLGELGRRPRLRRLVPARLARQARSTPGADGRRPQPRIRRCRGPARTAAGWCCGRRLRPPRRRPPPRAAHGSRPQVAARRRLPQPAADAGRARLLAANPVARAISRRPTRGDSGASSRRTARPRSRRRGCGVRARRTGSARGGDSRGAAASRPGDQSGRRGEPRSRRRGRRPRAPG
jgi:hypothetical protein